MKTKTKCRFFKIENIFVIAALLFGCIFSIMIPIEHVPDERTHLLQMDQSYTGSIEHEEEIRLKYYEGQESEKTYKNEKHKINVDKYIKIGSQHFSEKFRISDFHISLMALKYVPMAIGFFAGLLLNASMLVCLQLAEFTALLFYIAMGYLILKTAPVKKEIFLFALLMPMTMQQCSSVSYDAVIIPLCFFITAYALKLKFQERKVVWKDIILFLALLLLITYIKLPYIFIGLLIFIIPVSKFDLKIGKKYDPVDFMLKYRVILIILLIIIISAAIYLSRGSMFTKVIISVFIHPVRFMYLILNSIKIKISWYIGSFVGDFAKFEAAAYTPFTLIIFFMVLTYLNLFASNTDVEKLGELKKRDRFILCIISVIVILLIFVAMITWSYIVYGVGRDGNQSFFNAGLFKIGMIEGVQGRYLIPLFPALLIGLTGLNPERSRRWKNWLQVIYYVFMYGNAVIIFLYRFWIV